MIIRLALISVIVALASPVWCGPILTLVDLGTLGGAAMTGAALNSAGVVAGYGVDANGVFQAFTSSSGVITPAAVTSASARGINGNGQVVGNVNLGVNSHATLWVNGAAQQLGGLGGTDSYGNAINDHGQAVGMATTQEGAGRAVLYSNGSVQDISPSGSLWSTAYGVNNSGAAVGYFLTPGFSSNAFVWSASGGATTLGTLGGRNSYAFDINESGVVTGHSSTASGDVHAFTWTSMGGFVDLGTLTGGSQSYAYGINSAGSVVGYATVADGDVHAFAYLNGIMIDLNSLVSAAVGWTLHAAYAINDAGQITGSGLLNGVEHAFRLDPPSLGGIGTAGDVTVPEPSSLWAMILGAGLIGSAKLLSLIRH